MATLFSIPTYMPDPTTVEQVVGYDVQACAPTSGLPLFTGTWTTLSNSPFASPHNIIDTTGVMNTRYRVRPIRQVAVAGTPYTLDTPWSRGFIPSDPLYDNQLTSLLAKFRSTYLNDIGIPQSNGTNVDENIGAGNGLWLPDGTQKRFILQYVDNDDPVAIQDMMFTLTWRDAYGVLKPAEYSVDYNVEARSGIVEFKTAPLPSDYLRFDFNRAYFTNEDLLRSLTSAIGALSSFGINGFATHTENNLVYTKEFINSDLMEIVCKLAIHLMRIGLTEYALRNTTTWRDGGMSQDPYPSRALQFLVQQGLETEDSVQRRANAYIRTHSAPIVRGDMQIMTDISQGTPWTSGLLGQFTNFGYYNGPYGNGLMNIWWL